MSKNLCPENTVTFETSYQIRFETPIPAGTYTCSAVIEKPNPDASELNYWMNQALEAMQK